MTTEEWATLIPAPIDETNVCLDVLLDAMFDNHIHADIGKKSVGFALTVTTYAECYSNILEVHPFTSFIDMDGCHFKTWAKSIVNRLTDVDVSDCEDCVLTFLDDCDGDSGLVYRVVIRPDNFIHISVKHNMKIPSLID